MTIRPSRRDFLRTSLLGSASLALLDPARALAVREEPPMRFIFLHRGNGLWPKVMVPPKRPSCQASASKLRW